MGHVFASAAASDPGLVRPTNEDALYSGHRLVVVADGVGGQPDGEVASDLAVRIFTGLDGGAAPDDPVATLDAAFRTANQELIAADRDRTRSGMATTVTALLLGTADMALVHAGDSRAYRWRDGALCRLTRDDTYVQWLVDTGVLSPEQARIHPHRSVVTRVLPTDDALPAAERLEPVVGDRYLLCSDGLTDVLPDERLAEVLGGTRNRADCGRRLVELALRAGGPDNVSVIVADVLTDGAG